LGLRISEGASARSWWTLRTGSPARLEAAHRPIYPVTGSPVVTNDLKERCEGWTSPNNNGSPRARLRGVTRRRAPQGAPAPSDRGRKWRTANAVTQWDGGHASSCPGDLGYVEVPGIARL